MTNLPFSELDNAFKNNDFPTIENDIRGIRFLKLRSMSRKVTMEAFCIQQNIDLGDIPSKKYLPHVFEIDEVTDVLINTFINQQYQEEREIRLTNQDYLIDQLSRLQHFDWGGSFGNSLEKNIVNNYVKKIQSYELINEEVEGSLLSSLRGYTLNSWYNHWTSIIIEDLFKDHEVVLPTVGLVKKIDFFINNVPFDLKVTYFPKELLKEKLKITGNQEEFHKLKEKCDELGIKYTPENKAKDLRGNLKKIQNDITKFISENKDNITALEEKAVSLNIECNQTGLINQRKIKIKKALRSFRDEVKKFVKNNKYKKELTLIKEKCTELEIFIPLDLNDALLEQHLLNKLKEDVRPSAQSFVENIFTKRKQIIQEAEKNPTELKKWFYENQGEARFDASNRFFLVLTDERDMSNSWKLKRNLVFLRDNINKHLTNLSVDMQSLETEFYWHKDQKTYNCKSDILFLKYTN